MSWSLLSGHSQEVVLIKNHGQPDEQRQGIRGVIQSQQGFFEDNTPIYEGDVIEVPDPRGGVRLLTVAKVDIHQAGGTPRINHISVVWGAAPRVAVAPVRRLGLSGLHPEVLGASSDLFTDGHYDSAIFEAFKAVEVRVRTLSGLPASGRDLMARAFGDSEGALVIAQQAGRSAKDEQEGFKLLFMGAMQAIRNLGAHERALHNDPEQALEYLGFASLLMRRLDQATKV